MAASQVNSLHPVPFYASNERPKTIKNLSNTTVYYRANPNVSSSLNDGSLTQNQEVTVVTTTWFVTKATTFTGSSTSVASEPQVVEAELETTGVGQVIPGRREIESVSAVVLESSAVGVYATISAVTKFEKATALKFTTGENALNVFYYDPKLYEITGRPHSLTLEMLLMTDNVAPTASFIAGMYPLEKIEGAEKKHEATVEAVVTGSTVEITTPAAKTATQKAVTFTPPTAAGFYVLAVETITATTAAKSFEAITLTMFASD